MGYKVISLLSFLVMFLLTLNTFLLEPTLETVAMEQVSTFCGDYQRLLRFGFGFLTTIFRFSTLPKQVFVTNATNHHDHNAVVPKDM